MNLDKLRRQLEIDEGCVYEMYLDTKALPTFGIGHLIKKEDEEYGYCVNIYPFLYRDISVEGKMIRFDRCEFKIKVSERRVIECFNQDIKSTIDDCYAVFPDFKEFDEEVKQIVANMIFNLGVNRFRGFRRMIAAINDKNFKEAARQMIDSKWYGEVKSRSKRLVSRMDDYANDYLCDAKNSKI